VEGYGPTKYTCVTAATSGIFSRSCVVTSSALERRLMSETRVRRGSSVDRPESASMSGRLVRPIMREKVVAVG